MLSNNDLSESGGGGVTRKVLSVIQIIEIVMNCDALPAPIKKAIKCLLESAV